LPGAAANEYSIGLILPSPTDEVPRYWLSKATIPAKAGAEAEVPPITEQSPPEVAQPESA